MEPVGMSQEEKKILYGPVTYALATYLEQDPARHQPAVEDIIICLARQFATHPVERGELISTLCHHIFECGEA